MPNRQLKLRDFWKNIYMLKYLAVTIPGLYYMTAFGYGSVLFATTGSQLFHEYYDFSVSQTGLMLSIPLLIGCIIGEANAGWLIDWMSLRYARKHDGERVPEARLDALWGGLLVPIGVIIEGVCLSHYRTVSWVGAAFGMVCPLAPSSTFPSSINLTQNPGHSQSRPPSRNNSNIRLHNRRMGQLNPHPPCFLNC